MIYIQLQKFRLNMNIFLKIRTMFYHKYLIQSVMHFTLQIIISFSTNIFFDYIPIKKKICKVV